MINTSNSVDDTNVATTSYVYNKVSPITPANVLINPTNTFSNTNNFVGTAVIGANLYANNFVTLGIKTTPNTDVNALGYQYFGTIVWPLGQSIAGGRDRNVANFDLVDGMWLVHFQIGFTVGSLSDIIIVGIGDGLGGSSNLIASSQAEYSSKTSLVYTLPQVSAIIGTPFYISGSTVIRSKVAGPTRYVLCIASANQTGDLRGNFLDPSEQKFIATRIG